MAVPSYTEDLTDINTAEAIGTWVEPGTWNLGGTPVAADADYPYIQGSFAITQATTKTGLCGMIVDNGSDITLPTDGAFLVWQNFSSPPAMNTYANGGMRVMVGSSSTAFYGWDVGGRDDGRMPYGGWQNHAVNTTVSVDDTVGAPTATLRWIGAAVDVTTGIGKGNPHQIDVLRYGRCSSIFEFGETANYCTFAGYATQNDGTSNRWGLLQAIAGGYLWKGKMTLGTSGNLCDFRDSNVSVILDNTRKVTANFNTIEVNNASTRVDWTNVSITSLGTVSPGRLVCNANADLNWDKCQFVNMGAFTFGGTNSTCTTSIFRGCGQIDAAGGLFTSTSISGYTGAADTSSLVWNVATNPDGFLDDMLFTKHSSTNHHAIQLGTSSLTTVTFRGITFTDFSASDGDNHSVIYLSDRGSDTAWTLNAVSCTGTLSYKKQRSGDTVTVVQDPVTTTITVTAISTGLPIQDARVLVTASDNTGTMPFEETVTSITRTGVTAAVAHTTHGLVSGKKVLIKGATEMDYNGVWTISNVTANAYDYTLPDSGAGALTINVVASAGTFTRTTGDFTTDGFRAGQTITPSGFTNGGNNAIKVIASVSTTVITVTDTSGLVNETGNNNERIQNTPSSPASGTKKATGVVIDGLTNASGVISDTRTHAIAQPITGRVRKATGGTLYKTGSVSGTIHSVNGFSVAVQLIGDS